MEGYVNFRNGHFHGHFLLLVPEFIPVSVFGYEEKDHIHGED
jgi:hypothetical protein